MFSSLNTVNTSNINSLFAPLKMQQYKYKTCDFAGYKDIAFFKNNGIRSDSDNKSRKIKLSYKIAITAGLLTAAVGADLLLAKGKLFSNLTRGKVSFISIMAEDIENILKKDPAAKNNLEVLLCYPGLHAIWLHRISHKLHQWKIPVIPRLLSNFGRFFTGIEIHPGTKIGRRVFFDHTGAIIGETAEIGNDVELIGRVVLGGTGKEKGLGILSLGIILFYVWIQ